MGVFLETNTISSHGSETWCVVLPGSLCADPRWRGIENGLGYFAYGLLLFQSIVMNASTGVAKRVEVAASEEERSKRMDDTREGGGGVWRVRENFNARENVLLLEITKRDRKLTIAHRDS